MSLKITPWGENSRRITPKKKKNVRNTKTKPDTRRPRTVSEQAEKEFFAVLSNVDPDLPDKLKQHFIAIAKTMPNLPNLHKLSLAYAFLTIRAAQEAVEDHEPMDDRIIYATLFNSYPLDENWTEFSKYIVPTPAEYSAFIDVNELSDEDFEAETERLEALDEKYKRKARREDPEVVLEETIPIQDKLYYYRVLSSHLGTYVDNLIRDANNMNPAELEKKRIGHQTSILRLIFNIYAAIADTRASFVEFEEEDVFQT